MRLLHHASEENDLHTRIPVFQVMQMSQTAVYLQIGVFPYCTGIVDHHVSLFAFLPFISNLIHDTRHSLGLLFIHLASERGQTVGKRSAGSSGLLFT